MYNAHMIYKFKEGQLEKGIEIWKEAVGDKIKEAEGFIRVQLYSKDNEMMAIGSWENKTFAETFMKSGIFKDIMGNFGDLLTETPINTSYELRHFESK